MDPLSVFATTLSKLITIGITLDQARASEGFDAEDLQALRTVLREGASISSSFMGRAELNPAALQLALTARAFGRALGRHWGGSTSMVPEKTVLPDRIAAWRNKEEHARRKEIGLRTKQASLCVIEPGDTSAGTAEIELLGALTGLPQNNPYYRALWAAFTNPDLVEDHSDSLLSLCNGDTREFERHFRLAFGEAMATPEGARFQRWREQLILETPDLMRAVLARDLADWGSRHVFGNTQQQSVGNPLPFMSLDQTYVEPKGRQNPQDAPEPIQALVRRLLAEHRVVVVQADFGHGKSLSARRLARDLAKAHETLPTLGLDIEYPIFIKCVRDIDGGYNHERAVRAALRHTANDALGQVLPFDFEGFALPGAEQRTLFIMDGLDELAFGHGQLETMFRRLHEATHDKHRAVVFTRPGALAHNCLPKGTPVVALEGFDEIQITTWLGAWGRLPGQSTINLAQIPVNLQQLATTPILLLMIASTWEPGEHTANLGRATLYEKFFQQIARGKHDADKDVHENILRASESLLNVLRDNGEVDRTEQDPVGAMLWMMSKIAWKGHVLAYAERPSELRNSDVEHLLRDYQLAPELSPMITIGLLIALQYNPVGGSTNLLFGHQSFREFLVARYWKSQLLKLARGGRNRGVQKQVEETLMEGRLLQSEDRSFDFLRELLSDLSVSERSVIHGWAEEVANDEALTAPLLCNDRHSALRESALAIGSALSNKGHGLVMEHAATMRSLLAFFYLKNLSPIIYAPYIDHQRASLSGANLSEANFNGANLSGADLSGAVLHWANLSDADLSGATLIVANLVKTNLKGANLTRTDLRGARLDAADLSGAKFLGADLSSTELRGADLVAADLAEVDLIASKLTGANLGNANLSGANLSGADLSSTILNGANLSGANLSGANLSYSRLIGANLKYAHFGGDPDANRARLCKADLSGVDLSGADLSGTDLKYVNFSGADLSGADLSGADLKYANFSGTDLSAANLSAANLNGVLFLTSSQLQSSLDYPINLLRQLLAEEEVAVT